jgi:hypothetical protein
MNIDIDKWELKNVSRLWVEALLFASPCELIRLFVPLTIVRWRKGRSELAVCH